MKIPASKVPAQVWADKARRRADLDEVESMLLSSWDDSKQVYRIGKELWDELRIDEADEVPVDALLRLPYGCIFIERRWVDEYEQLLTDDMADTWGEASCYVTRYYEGCFCWVEGRTLFVDILTHHCEMRHTDDYGSDVAEAKAGSYDLAPTGDAGATLNLKAQGDAKNVKEDIAKDKTVATITWTFAAGNAAGGISVDDSWEGNHEMGID